MRRIMLTIFISLVVIAVAVSGVYVWQNHNVKYLKQQNVSLGQKVKDLQGQYNNAETAINISTSTWKKYCDSLSSVCMNYPSQWILTGGLADSYPMVNATLKNPGKTLQINYTDPMVKDGGGLSVHIVSLNNLTIGNSKITVVGSIPVSSVNFEPTYFVLNESFVPQNATPGKISLIYAINPTFSAGSYPADSISMSGGPTTKITSLAQAQAWFNSINGKTMLKIMKSLMNK